MNNDQRVKILLFNWDSFLKYRKQAKIILSMCFYIILNIDWSNEQAKKCIALLFSRSIFLDRDQSSYQS